MATKDEFSIVIENNLKEVVNAIKDMSIQMSLMTGKMTKSQAENFKWNNTIKAGTRAFDAFHGGLISTNKVFNELNYRFRMGRDLLSSYTIGLLGVGFSINGLISSATSLVKEQWQLGDTMVYLTDSTTSASQALGAYYGANKGSKGSLDQTASGLKALADAGMSLSPIMLKLASDSGTLEQATGLGAESWARMSGQLVKTFKASQKEIRTFQSALLATNLKAGELQHTADGLIETLHKLQYTFKDGINGANNFARGYSGAVKVMTKMGIEAQTANKFISDLLDPDKYEENLRLFGQLGLTTEDFFKALEGGGDAGAFLEKALGNLPQLARSIQNIADPLQRIRFAKNLGIDMQIASKMARATQGDIESMLNDYKKKAVEDKEFKKREEQAKVNAKKYEESLDAFKRNALMPLMNFVSKIMTGSGMQLLSKISSLTNKVLSKVLLHGAPIIDKVISVFDRVLGIMNKDFDKGLRVLGEEVFNYISKGFQRVAPLIIKTMSEAGSTLLKEIIKNAPNALYKVGEAFLSALGTLFQTNPIIASLIGLKAGSTVLKSISGSMEVGKGLYQGAKAFLRGNTVGVYESFKKVFDSSKDVEERQVDILAQIEANTRGTIGNVPDKDSGMGIPGLRKLAKFKKFAKIGGSALSVLGGLMSAYSVYSNFQGINEQKDKIGKSVGTADFESNVDELMRKRLENEMGLFGAGVGGGAGFLLGALGGAGVGALPATMAGIGIGQFTGEVIGSQMAKISSGYEKVNEELIFGNKKLQKDFEKQYEEKLKQGVEISRYEKLMYEASVLRKTNYLTRMEREEYKYLKNLDNEKRKLSDKELERLKQLEKRMAESQGRDASSTRDFSATSGSMVTNMLEKVGVGSNLAEDIGVKFGYWIKYLSTAFKNIMDIGLAQPIRKLASGLLKIFNSMTLLGLGGKFDEEIRYFDSEIARVEALRVNNQGLDDAKRQAELSEFALRNQKFMDNYREGKSLINQFRAGDMSGQGRFNAILARYTEFFESSNQAIRQDAINKHKDLIRELQNLNKTNEKGNGILGGIKSNTEKPTEKKDATPVFVNADMFGEVSIYRSV